MVVPPLAGGQLITQRVHLQLCVLNITLTPTNILHALVSHDMDTLKALDNPTKRKPIEIVAKRHEPVT